MLTHLMGYRFEKVKCESTEANYYPTSKKKIKSMCDAYFNFVTIPLQFLMSLPTQPNSNTISCFLYILAHRTNENSTKKRSDQNCTIFLDF